MSFLGSDKSPKQILTEQEEEIAEEIWNLIEGEEADIEKLRQLEKQNPEESVIRKAERALESLTVMIEEDLAEIKDDEEKMEKEFSSGQFEGKFAEAARHNLDLLEFVTGKLAEDDSNLEKWLNKVENEDKTEDEIKELLTIEEQLEGDLEDIKAAMKSGEGTDFSQGWIDLLQFN